MQMIAFALPRRSPATLWLSAMCCMAVLWLAGCATQAPPPTNRGLPLPLAVDAAIDHLMSQIGTSWFPSLDHWTMAIEPLHDSATGQQTVSTREAGRLIAARLRQEHGDVEILPFQQASLARTRWLLSGKLVQGVVGNAVADRSRQTLQLSLVELSSGLIVADASVAIVDDKLDNSPTAFFEDSPVLMSALHGAASKPAPVTLRQATANALVDEGMAAYDAGRFSDAHALFTAAQALPDADVLSVNTGLYLVYSRIGQTAAARDAFGRMAAAGIARRSLAVKFLFEPGKVDFWADPNVSGPYAMWIDQIARQAVAAEACMSIVGHSSRTGTEEFNDQLSRERAVRVSEAMMKAAPDSNIRLRASGMGFHENLVGTGTDDVRDALDRRVEFRFSDCAANSVNVSTRAGTLPGASQ